MTVITGYAGTDKTTLVEPVTCQPHDRSRIVLDTLPVSHYRVAQNQVVQAGSKPNVIVVSSHSAKRGDYVVFEAIATIATQAAFVLSTTSTTITVAQPFTAAPIAGDTYTIFRPSKILTDSSGALTVSGTANVTIVSPLAVASPPNSASGVITRVVGSVDAIYGEFSTAYTYLPVGGFDSAAELLAPLPLTSSGTKVAVAATSLPLPTGAATEAKQTQPGVDIGDVTINNAAGASAVNIQDGGNSITVDATSLPLPTGAATAALQSSVQQQDGVSGEFCNRVMGYDLDSSTFMPIPITNFGTTIPVALGTGIYGAGIGNTGNLTAAGQSVILNTLNSYSEGVILVSGTYSATLAFEALKGSVWEALPVWRGAGGSAAESSSGALVNTSRIWRFNAAGYDTIKVRCSAYTSGTAAVEIQMVSLGAHTSQTLLPTGQTTMANSQSVSIASDQSVIPVGGDIAHDAVDSGNPVKIGGKALTADPTAVATGDRVNALFDKLGKQVMLPGALLEKYGSATSASSITTTTSTSLVAATAGVIRVITGITVSNMHASVATIVNILDGTTVKWHGPAAALGGGFSSPPVYLVGTVNTAINVQCVTSGASVRASVSYFEIAG